jgi:hypothetical protein
VFEIDQWTTFVFDSGNGERFGQSIQFWR